MVLIVEDDELGRGNIKHALKQYGLQERKDYVIPYTLGETLRFIDAGQFDAVFIDVHLARFSDFDTYAARGERYDGQRIAQRIPTGIPLYNISSGPFPITKEGQTLQHVPYLEDGFQKKFADLVRLHSTAGASERSSERGF